MNRDHELLLDFVSLKVRILSYVHFQVVIENGLSSGIFIPISIKSFSEDLFLEHMELSVPEIDIEEL